MIVYACADLMFATRIRAAAEDLHRVSRPARNPDMLQARLDRIDDGKPNDPVSLLLIDLDLQDLGLALIQQARQHTPDLPIYAFGPHVATDLLQQAHAAGASRVLTRGAFVKQLTQLLTHP